MRVRTIVILGSVSGPRKDARQAADSLIVCLLLMNSETECGKYRRSLVWQGF
jgi:hypothetical protein